MNCSVLIVSNKENILTLKDQFIEKYASEIIIDQSPGLAFARNKLANKAKNEILIFLDDDVILNQNIWEQITKIQPHQILMAQGRNHPIGRIMALRKEDLNEIGGFDENIRYNGEDLDFYWRALKQGYTVGTLPSCYIYHKPHPKLNWVKCHFESAYTKIKHDRISLDFFIQTNPIIAILHLSGFIYFKIRGKTN